MAKKILITGSDGQLGETLHRELSPKFDILASARQPKHSTVINRHVLAMDVTNSDEISQVINSYRPDIIINCAAFTKVDESETQKKTAYKVNVEGINKLLHISHKDTKLIQISTDYVFDGDNGPYIEQDHTFPVNYYGKSKLEAENMIRGSRRRYLILRPNVIFSSRIDKKGNFFAWVYNSLSNNQKINVVTDQSSNPAWAFTFAQAIMQCILLDCEGIYHFGSANYLSRFEFALEIAEIFEFDNSLINPILTCDLAQIAKRPNNSGLKTDKIEREANLTIHSTRYGLKEIRNQLVSA